MKKKPKTIPAELRDPKLPQFGDNCAPLDISDELPGMTPHCALPQQPNPANQLPDSPPQMW